MGTMSRIVVIAAIATALMISSPALPQAPALPQDGVVYTNKDVMSIRSAKDRLYLFNRMYKGRTFSDIVAFNQAQRERATDNRLSYSIFMTTVVCMGVSDGNTLNQVAEWKSGRLSRVSGAIEGVGVHYIAPVIELSNCSFTAPD